MGKLLATAALCLALVAPARAASTYSLTTDASSTTLKLNGRLHMQSLANVEQLVIDSVRGLFTWTYGIQASTANFTGSGATTYSVTTSSGISVGGTGGVLATFFQATGAFYGSLVGNASSATSATTATNLASGAAGSMPYQTGSGATSFVSSVASRVLSIVGTTPTWLSFLPTSVSVSTANVSPGFNGASNFVQVGADGKLTAIDGSNLTNISGTLSGGTTGTNSRWTSATSQVGGGLFDNGTSVTLPVASSMTFNGAVGGAASFSSSSWTYVASQSFGSALTTPHFVSSVTITTDGLHPLMACYYGTGQDNSAASSALGWAVWIDNVKYLPSMPQGTMGGSAQFQKCSSGNVNMSNCSGCQPIFGADIPAAGVHVFAVYFWDPQNFNFSVPANYIVTDKAVWGAEQVR
jgi:hypothetical protein